MSEINYPTQSNFQSESTASGKEFEDLVNEDLLSRGYTILGNNVKIPEVGINVDYIAEKDGVVEYGEDKGGKAGNKKRPGAQRTDNVKKAICNGALLKTKYPNANYVIYFSAKPKKGKSSDLMINTAIAAGYVNEIRYLEYKENDSLSFTLE